MLKMAACSSDKSTAKSAKILTEKNICYTIVINMSQELCYPSHKLSKENFKISIFYPFFFSSSSHVIQWQSKYNTHFLKHSFCPKRILGGS